MFASTTYRRLAAAAAAAVCALALLLGFASPSPGAATPVTYHVKAGDTLWSIAASHSSDGDIRAAIYTIRSTNHLPDSSIAAGQTLVLP